MSSNEQARLAALNGYGLLDTPNEPDFDAIVREAAAFMRAPIALISLVDEDRQWFKARVGLDAQEMPRSISFCTHALRGNEVFVVPDAAEDARFSQNPLVTDNPNIRFYAGAPLRTANGHRIGTLCVIDRSPRGDITDRERQRLESLAARTVDAFEKRTARLALADKPAAA